MMSSPAGSSVFALISLLIIAIGVLLLLRRFLPLRSTPAYILLPIFLALALPISIILLVPIDLASSLKAQGEAPTGISLPNSAILISWRVTYWLTFSLTWFILPLLGQYLDSGYRTPKSRIVYSLKSNGQYQFVILVCGTVGLTYVFYQNGFEKTSVKGLVMALAYFWGLALAIYLMGHGLVALPRSLYRNADNNQRLRRIHNQAPNIHDQLHNAAENLKELETQVTLLRQRKHAISRDHQQWVQEISDNSGDPQSPFLTSRDNQIASKLPAIITDRYLAELSRKLSRARHKHARFIDAWHRIVQAAVDTQTIIDASTTKSLDFQYVSSRSSYRRNSVIPLTPYSRYLIYNRLIPAIKILSATVLSLASVCLIWSELVKFVAPQLSIVSITVVTYSTIEGASVGFTGQLIASFWILYMCAAVLVSFDDVKVWGNRALVRRNTYGESATWYSGQVAKLTVPLVYNFATLLRPEMHRKTVFYHFLGQYVNLTPLGKGFDYCFPMFILLPVCATLLNIYARIKSVFSLGMLDIGDDGGSVGSGPGSWREGRDLIDQALAGTSLSEHSTGYGRGSSSRSDQAYGYTRRDRQLDNDSTSPAYQVKVASSDRQSRKRTEVEQQQARRLEDATRAAEAEDENFFQGFAHRVRNTFENVERPDWLADIGKRPKWMKAPNRSSESSHQDDFRTGMSRWFGGKSDSGRLRI